MRAWCRPIPTAMIAGMQPHSVTQGVDARAHIAALEREWQRVLEAVAGMGSALAFMELDVRDKAFPADVATRDVSVAADTRNDLDLMFAYPMLEDVVP